MWTIAVNLRILSDSSVTIKSPVALPVSNYPIWSPAGIALDGYSLEQSNALIFDFNLVHPRGTILIRSLSVPVGRLNYGNNNDQLTRIFSDDQVSISYMAFKYREEEHLDLGQIHISVISIKYDIEHLLKPADGDRIALQCGDYQVERCQSVHCMGNGVAHLTWTSGPSHRWQYPISMIDDPVDSPDYYNQYHLMPKFVALQQQFALLNYRFTPPTIVPFVVKFDLPLLQIYPDTIDGKQAVIRRRNLGKRFQVYSLKKVVNESIVITFFYIFIRSLVQIQLIEMKWNNQSGQS